MIKRVLGAAPGLKETAVRVYRGVCSVRYLRYALTTKVDPRLVVFESYPSGGFRVVSGAEIFVQSEGFV